MRAPTTIAILSMALWALPAYAAVTVSPVVVRAGYFMADDCAPSMNPKVANECICHADIKKPQVAGLPEQIAERINQQLALLPEKLANESCEGAPTAPPAEGMQVNSASADFELAFQSAGTLTMFSNYSTLAAGSAQALSGTEGFTFELGSGTLIDPIALLKPEQRMKADAYIKQELLKKYPTDLSEEAKNHADPYLTENGCDTCTIYYGPEGWVVRFQIDSVAPYALGEPEVTLPKEIIPAPEKLMVKS
jgi:hypothetical protein